MKRAKEKEILIDTYRSFVRVAVVERPLTDGRPSAKKTPPELIEYWQEHAVSPKFVGKIYKGTVANVLPGMNAAFVDIGLAKNGFLYAGDALASFPPPEAEPDGIALGLSIGDVIMCQVSKDEFGTKGVRLTMNISIPGRFLVMMPKCDYIGVSRKIEDETARARLTALIEQNLSSGAGFIVRTKAAEATDEEIVSEIAELREKWLLVQDRFKTRTVNGSEGMLLFSENDLASRVTRDMLDGTVKKIVTNSEKMLDDMVSELPSAAGLLELYTGAENLFDVNGIRPQIDGLLNRKVNLKNGGYLIIDRTEALTVIDVNTGAYIGKSDERDSENTMFSANKTAVPEIARQLRLRNIGGIVIVDFIDMHEEAHRDALLKLLEGALAGDTARVNIVGMTGLGLVELTRKKTRGMLESVFSQPCPYCNGEGLIASDERIIERIENRLKVEISDGVQDTLLLSVHPQIAGKLFAIRFFEHGGMDDWVKKRVYVLPSEDMHMERFEIHRALGNALTLPDSARLLF